MEHEETHLLATMMGSSDQASQFLKAVANNHRLLILATLVNGERSVGELETLLDVRQPTLSQQLARLREEGLVVPRREGKMVFYRLSSRKAVRLVELMHELFHNDSSEPTHYNALLDQDIAS